MPDLSFHLAAAHEPAKMAMAWTPPKGMLSRVALYLSKPKPLMRVGPKVLAVDQYLSQRGSNSMG